MAMVSLVASDKTKSSEDIYLVYHAVLHMLSKYAKASLWLYVFEPGE